MHFSVILFFLTISAQIYILFYIIKNFTRVADQTIPSNCLCFNVITVTVQHSQTILSFDDRVTNILPPSFLNSNKNNSANLTNRLWCSVSLYFVRLTYDPWLQLSSHFIHLSRWGIKNIKYLLMGKFVERFFFPKIIHQRSQWQNQTKWSRYSTSLCLFRYS